MIPFSLRNSSRVSSVQWLSASAAVASTGTSRWGRVAGRPALLSHSVAPRLRGRAVCGAGGTRGGARGDHARLAHVLLAASAWGPRAFLLSFSPLIISSPSHASCAGTGRLWGARPRRGGRATRVFHRAEGISRTFSTRACARVPGGRGGAEPHCHWCGGAVQMTLSCWIH